MELKKRKEAVLFLGDYLRKKDERLNAFLHRTHFRNRWFTMENQHMAIDAICDEFLNEEKLNTWLNQYHIPKNGSPKKIGMIPAANIPLVGFHDMLSIFLAGHQSVIKVSERDEFITPFFIKKMAEEFPEIHSYFSFPDNISIKEIDGIIATGSNNSARYFESYFGHMNHIIRKNRNSVGILSGNENKEQLDALGKDVCQYFGLGCRNVSKLYVPEGYDFTNFLESLHQFRDDILHDKYKNNYDYQTTILILNKRDYWNSGSVIITEDESIASPISVVHFEHYTDLNNLENHLSEKEEQIQCIVSETPLKKLKSIPFGAAQSPTLSDYPDNIDTMEFLLNI